LTSALDGGELKTRGEIKSRVNFNFIYYLGLIKKKYHPIFPMTLKACMRACACTYTQFSSYLELFLMARKLPYLTEKEKHKLQMFEMNLLRKMFRFKRDQMGGEYRLLYSLKDKES
jgi:hypothetical protein